ncbi:MAG: response regulator [Candidatus Thiodiazotropha taylori]
MDSTKQKILLVDDDRLVLSALGPGLQAAGYQLETATSGKAALALCEQVAPDLAVLDMRMPGMDGIAVANWLREHTEIPFIFLTAYGEDDVVQQAIDAGALGYLLKPVDPPQLLAMVKTALKRGADNQQLREREGQLNLALRGNRDVSTAVGILIEREHMSEQAAFKRLRQHARSQQRKLPEVARELVDSAESLNRLSGSAVQVADSSSGLDVSPRSNFKA